MPGYGGQHMFETMYQKLDIPMYRKFDTPIYRNFDISVCRNFRYDVSTLHPTQAPKYLVSPTSGRAILDVHERNMCYSYEYTHQTSLYFRSEPYFSRGKPTCKTVRLDEWTTPESLIPISRPPNRLPGNTAKRGSTPWLAAPH